MPSPEAKKRYDTYRELILAAAAKIDPGPELWGHHKEAFEAVREVNRLIGEMCAEKPIPVTDMKELDESIAEALCTRPPHCWIDLFNDLTGTRRPFVARVRYFDKHAEGHAETPLVALANALKMMGLYDAAFGVRPVVADSPE